MGVAPQTLGTLCTLHFKRSPPPSNPNSTTAYMILIAKNPCLNLGINNIDACPGGTVDPVWNIEWDFTIVGSQDVQTCPRIDGIQTFGKLQRLLS